MLVFFDICSHYPFIWDELIEDLAQEDDEELNAPTLSVTGHFSEVSRLSDLRKHENVVTTFMGKQAKSIDNSEVL